MSNNTLQKSTTIQVKLFPIYRPSPAPKDLDKYKKFYKQLMASRYQFLVHSSNNSGSGSSHFFYDAEAKDPDHFEMPNLNASVGISKIVIGDTIFVIGGYEQAKNHYLNSVFAVKVNFRKYRKKCFYTSQVSSMITSRCSIGLNQLLNATVYACGGIGEGGSLRLCEKYSIEKDVWTPIKSLQINKASFALFPIADRYLYAICGNKDTTPLDDLEVFDSMDEEKGWTLVQVVVKSGEKLEVRGCFTTLLTPNSLVLAGGYARKTLDDARQVTISQGNWILEEKPIWKLPSPSEFYSKPFVSSGHTHCLGYPSGDYFRFSHYKRNWKWIKLDDWKGGK